MRELEGTKLYGWAQVSLEVAEGGLLVSAGADRLGGGATSTRPLCIR